ncbi:hypothetical protein A2773_00405 [Candidatus Gottesmanbacteria bacterium RIFCSPHIGHO2_01_FULL_39_10]|uniref:Glycosyltransferase RgtA/B/C/D-like domain-containing protein n=1 Tax=Candidatus Gottesmanbacteria bacterium RIFCSPHIGHO2_01_FULL_39_10 TaxID=1798375 RepID=A0A1F5ZM94_9BACT|nr:MAG: hypothetical protein A2773_00405 [Candidatus Gottesmanbacteria bacterium RIFCSPHIGHO2_01_FULL_39_10]
MPRTYLFSILLVFLATLLSITPDIYRLIIAPANTTFPLIHNYSEDYFGYLQYMHQGLEGRWLITSRFTPEKFIPYFVYTFYSLLGHISRITHITLPWMYFLSRIIFSITLSFCILLIISKLFSKYKLIIAILFVLFATGFWTIASQSLALVPSTHLLPVYQFLSYWSHFDPIARTTYIPHHLLSTTLGLLSIYFLVSALEENNIKKGVLAGLLGLISGFIFYSTMINILGGITIGIIIIIFRNKNTSLFSFIFYLLIYFLLSSLSIIYLYFLSHTTFPWTLYDDLKQRFYFPVSFPEYILALGPTFLLTLIGLKEILKEKKLLTKFLLGWAIFPFFGFFFLLPIFPKYGNMMFLEATSYIPLGILAVYGINQLKIIIKNRKICISLLTILFLYFLPPLTSSLQKEITMFPPYIYNLYIPTDILKGIDWLDKNSPPEAVVLSGGYFGNVIPAFSHNKVVYGHKDATYQASLKHEEMLIFFSQNDIPKAKEILLKYRVSYIFYSLDTDPPKDEFIKSLNLQKIYENSKVKIFKI